MLHKALCCLARCEEQRVVVQRIDKSFDESGPLNRIICALKSLAHVGQNAAVHHLGNLHSGRISLESRVVNMLLCLVETTQKIGHSGAVYAKLLLQIGQKPLGSGHSCHIT